MRETSNKERYKSLIEESKALERVGRSIRTHNFPMVMKNVGFLKAPESISPSNEGITKNVQLKLDEGFKFLPNIRHSSYQLYRQTPVSKDLYQKIEPINTDSLWRQETIIPYSDLFKVNRAKRTQIISVETLFGSPLNKMQVKGPDVDKQLRKAKISRIYSKIQKKSEERTIEYQNQSV